MKTAVTAERERRAWSVREAALAGGVSNTTWSRYEDTGHLTRKMRRAVADAFGWPLDWSDRLADGPPLETVSGDNGDRMAELEREVSRLSADLDRLGSVVLRLAQDFRRSLGVHVDSLEDDTNPPERDESEDDRPDTESGS